MDSRKRFCSSHQCFLFCLLFGLVYFAVYCSNIADFAVDWNSSWWLQTSRNSTARQWTLFVQLQKNVTPSEDVKEQNGTATRNHTLNTTEGRTNITKVTDVELTAERNSSVSVPTTQKVLEPLTPPPYVSPGPYLVEYPSDYHFTINQPKKCEEKKPFVVLLVPVAPRNWAHRDIVRSTWGRESLVLDKVVSLFFLLGLYTGEGSQQLQEQLQLESEEHQDLLQANFVDCYKNLTIKTMMMLEWLDAHCSSVPYAMKIDSDMFLVVPNLIKMLANTPRTNYLTGLVATQGQVLRNPNSKWYVPQDVFPRPFYPRYALGLGYVWSSDLSKKILEASKHVKAIYIEDVYLGLCMEYLGIAPTDPPNWNYFQIIPVPYSRCAFSKLIATTTNERDDRVKMWADFSKPGPYC